MEAILVRALESKLKYWLRSFSRDQFKLQGRSVHLYNLDLNGDVLHATIGLPPTLRVAQARVGKFELKLPSFSNVNSEPIVVDIDKLDIVLVETKANEVAPVVGSKSSTTPTKGSSTGYGFADKIADGMTIAVGTVNLMLETRGGGGPGGAAWTPPLASITIRNLLLYTTNEHWKVVNLKESREFFANKKCIYIFKKLEWESLSVDLLPHPDMFADEMLSDTVADSNRDNGGARRRFFGGERFLDSIAGAAYITMHRTEQNNPIALEVQVQVPETLCPALSEPGLRALLRFMTGVYVCINRGDVDPRTEESAEAAGRTMVKVTVDHVFLCIKDADFQLELLLQSLNYIRASAGDGDCSRTMSRLELGHLFLRDTHSSPSCTLVQPSMRNVPTDFPPVPSFASEKLWPRIYPLDSRLVIRSVPPMLCMFASQTTPSPKPPTLASQMVIQCQPLKINLQEESCIRIASFLADGVTVKRGVVSPETSLNAMYFSLKEFDLTVPVKSTSKPEDQIEEGGFTGARLHVEGFMVAQSPFLTFRLLNLDEDPACFPFWKGQPVDSSQKRWVIRATHVSIALETGSCDDMAQSANSSEWDSGLWRCVVMAEPCVEAAMVTADGTPLITIPPPGGVVRLGVSCKSYTSNTSSEQLLFVLKMYGYIGDVSQTLLRVSKGLETVNPTAGVQNKVSKGSTKPEGALAKIAPDDSAVILKVGNLELKLLESVVGQVAVEGPPLVQIFSRGISLKATHRMFGGAAAISSALCCQDIRVECVETEIGSPMAPVTLVSDSLIQFKEKLRQSVIKSADNPFSEHDTDMSSDQKSQPSGSEWDKVGKFETPVKELPKMRAVLWIGDERGSMARTDVTANGHGRVKRLPFLDITVAHMVPLRKEDAECHSLKVNSKIAGIRLGGGMVYTEALLHRFGVLGHDGGPGEAVKKVMNTLSNGPLAELIRPPSEVVQVSTEDDTKQWELGRPEDIDLDLQLQDWLFALEGAEGVAERARQTEDSFRSREQKCWHSTFRCLRITAVGQKQDLLMLRQRFSTPSPVQKITMRIEGFQALKPVLADGKPNLDKAYQDWSHADLIGTESVTKQDVNGSDGVSLSARKVTGQPVDVRVTSNSGINLEVNLIENMEEDPDIKPDRWIVESIEAAVKEPIEVKATKGEVEFLVQLCKLEVEASSRVAAGALKLLQLHGPVGQSAIDQLNNIGSGSLETILTPDKTIRRASGGFLPLTPPSSRHPQVGSKIEPTFAALEGEIENSRKLCGKLKLSLISTEIAGSPISGAPSQGSMKSLLQDLSQVSEHLRNMETLLGTLRNGMR